MLKRFADALYAIADKITYIVPDMKNIQSDLNDLNSADRITIYNKACVDYGKVLEAIDSERDGLHQKSVDILTDVLGDELLDEC